MKCSTCIHRIVCLHKQLIENFTITSGINSFIMLGVQECALYNNFNGLPEVTESEEDTVNHVQYDKNEEIIKDFSKRSEMIKKSYRDASGGQIICPNCKSNVLSLVKCIDCGKPVCEECGVTISVDAKEAGMLCQECWVDMMKKDDDAQKEAIQLNSRDTNFLKNVVRQDIPEGK